MPAVPPTKPVNTVRHAQVSYECLADLLRKDYPNFFPKDVCDFRPQPWLPPFAKPEENLTMHEMRRSFGTVPNDEPPPLAKDSPMRHFTRVLHLKDAPDWNDPEVRWGGLQALNLSTPLNVPPSIIFWSIEHGLPVYMHPGFIEATRKGPYAHSYAVSENVFSDESAINYRAELGLPPLEHPRPLRPSDALRYRIKDQRTVPDEQELASWVALLHNERVTSRNPSPETLIPRGVGTLAASALTSSKRPRDSDADIHSDGCASAERAPSHAYTTLPSSHGSHIFEDSTVGRVFTQPLPTSTLANPPCLSSTKPSADVDLGSSHLVTSRPTKRRKTSRSSTPSPAASRTSIAPPDEVKDISRTSPEPLSTVAEHSTAMPGSSPRAEPEPGSATPEPESARVKPIHDEVPSSSAVALHEPTPGSPSYEAPSVD